MALTRARRESWGLLVARLARITGDAPLAEDCVQDAFPRAWECWRTGAIPWRRRRLEAQKLRLLTEPAPEADPENDALLALIFTCAHPALPLEGQVALTLRWVAGLSTEETARAFFNHGRAVARGIAAGPGVGLELLDALAVERTLREYTYYHAARASFLDQMGRRGQARQAWTRARELASGEAQRAYLARRAEGRG